MTQMTNVVAVRELRQNLSRYLERVKAGQRGESEGFIVTERGREVARLTPSAHHETPLAQLIRRRGVCYDERLAHDAGSAGLSVARSELARPGRTSDAAPLHRDDV